MKKTEKSKRGGLDIWNKGEGWIFALKVVGGKLAISEAKTTLRPDKYGQPTVVYKVQ